MNIVFEKGLPLYEQIYRAIKKDIQEGVLSENTKLPSKRQLSDQLGVSINTVDGALSRLQSEGYIEIKPKSGCYVTRINALQRLDIALPIEHRETGERNFEVDFSPADVEKEHFPYAVWRRILRQTFDENDGDILKYPDSQGDYGLRQAIALYLRQSRGIDCRAEQIIIGSGTSCLLRCICGIIDKSASVVTEDPVYNRAYNIFSGMGHTCRAISTEKSGEIRGKLEKTGGDVFYVTPSHQFPLGYSLPAPVRIELLNWAAEKEGRYIIEDDYDSEFRYGTKPLTPIKSMDKNEKTVYIGTFSKCIAPSVRISYALLPAPLLERYRKTGSVYLSAVSGMEQRAVREFITGGHFERHINRMRNIYAKKQKKLLECLGKSVKIMGENAGHHILISLDKYSEQELLKRAADLSVKVYPVSGYFIGEVPEKYRSAVLLGYGALTEKDIEKGVSLLKKAWEI